MLLSCFFIAVLVEARLVTSPQCFYVYYKSQTQDLPSDWNLEMVVFYFTETRLGLEYAATLSLWIGIAILISRRARLRLGETFEAVSIGLSPLLVLAFPAAYWLDVPFSEWFVHRHYHDGAAEFPFWMLKPSFIAPVALITSICAVRTAMVKYRQSISANRG